MKRLTAWTGGLVVLTVLAVAAPATFAATKPVDTGKRMLDRMDRNVDGKIGFEEYRNAMMRRFDARDHDKNGVLEGKEIPKEWLVGADVAAAEGKVSQAAFAGELQPVFDRFDANRDGELDAAEVAAYAAARRAHEETTR